MNPIRLYLSEKRDENAVYFVRASYEMKDIAIATLAHEDYLI